MKKTKSIFFKISLVMTPIVLALDLIVIFLSYSTIYNSNLQNCEKQIRNAVENAANIAEGMDLEDDDLRVYLSDYYSRQCKMYDITYIFAILPDIAKNTETYLAIGFGDDASQEAIDTRYPGVTVEGMLNKEETEAYNGNKDGVILHEKTSFGESLVCYMPSYMSRYDRINDDDDDVFNDMYKEYRTRIIVGAEISLTALTKSFQSKFSQIALLTVTLTLMIVAAFAVILYFRVSKPIRRISGRMSSFVTDREKDQSIEKLEVKGNDEFSMVANSFNIMTDEIDRYLNDIDALNREKHTQEAELNIAKRIQMGLLQPERLDDERFGVRAYMLPAKDVGGDLYDYRVLSDGRIFVAIADVSGKGISAALFMSRAVTLLHQYAATDYTPAQILTEFNNTLASQNPGGVFITTFLAVYDPASGLLTYANAGHNYPYILSDRLITLDEPHGVAAGIFEGEEYEDATVPLSAGDTLFLYTDGVNEAKNKESAFYTTERLEKLLSEIHAHHSSESLDVVLSDLNRFTQDAEQSDDITMLSLYVKPRPAETVLHLKSVSSELVRIRDAIASLSVSDDLKRTLLLAAEEIFVNICSYAYETPGDVEVKLCAGEGAELIFIDGGKPFDPTSGLLDIDDYDHENAIGGLGRYLTFSMADRYRYSYQDGKNVLYLFFNEVNQDEHHENA